MNPVTEIDMGTMKKEMEALLDFMRHDYDRWSDRGVRISRTPSEVCEKMAENYAKGLRVVEGSKYLKVVGTGGCGSSVSVKMFVVNTDKDKYFRRGDILKPAGWKAPARNFSRGNVLDGTFDRVTWTGAH